MVLTPPHNYSVPTLGGLTISAAKSRKRIEVLVVQSNPADTLLTVEAFRAAGVASGLHCVDDGEDALCYVHRLVDCRAYVERRTAATGDLNSSQKPLLPGPYEGICFRSSIGIRVSSVCESPAR